MKKTFLCRFLLCLSLLVLTGSAARAGQLTVDVAKPGAAINPSMWGIFFEDINFGADGGLYAELIKNRGFEFPEPLMGWAKLIPSKARGTISVEKGEAFNAKNPHYVRLDSEGTAPLGLSNEGFRGIGLRAGETYDFSVRVRQRAGTPKLSVVYYGEDGTVLAKAELRGFDSEWRQYAAVLVPEVGDAKGRLALQMEGKGVLELDFVSLFPRQTWKGRPGGLRADMVQALADLRPGFFRFPGGCIVEGSELSRRYQWKDTIGPVEERPLLINRWNYEFLHRPAPDYFQSFGLGFFEYFQLCEDIGAEPLPILNCGMACQFNSGELCPLDQLDSYIQDALDLIEFANGPASSTWGAKRAAMGHPEPFGLKTLGIGNEQWGPQYIERFAKFQEVLKARHPEIALVGSAGPFPSDDKFHFLWEKLRELKVDIVDEHSYAKPEWFFEQVNRYDRYDRAGPKVFVGEYAVQTVATLSTKNRNTLHAAVAEAAFMTGLERNADVVRLASYAPLFAHFEAWQWTPNLLWTDNQRVLRTPNYYVQQLFAHHRGDRVLPVALGGLSTEEAARVFASAVWDERSGEVVVKVVNGLGRPVEMAVVPSGATPADEVEVITLSGEAPTSENTLAKPNEVIPRTSAARAEGGRLARTFPAQSVTVLRWPMRR